MWISVQFTWHCLLTDKIMFFSSKLLHNTKSFKVLNYTILNRGLIFYLRSRCILIFQILYIQEYMARPS